MLTVLLAAALLATTETFASVHCNLALPDGATITQLGYDAHDPESDGHVVCNAMNTWDAETVPPTLIEKHDPDPTSTAPFLGTGNTATPGDVRRTTPPNGGPVVAGSRTQVHVQCHLSGGASLRIYRFVAENELG